MCPRLPLDDSRYGCLCDLVSPCNLSLDCSAGNKPADLQNIGVVQACCSVRGPLEADDPFRVGPCPVAVATHHAPQTCGVPGVLGCGATLEVSRIHAARTVAQVMNLQPVWRADVPLVGHDVCATVRPVDPELAVPAIEQRSNPQPARAEVGAMLRHGSVLVNFRPEACAVGFGGGYNAHVSTSQKVLTMPPAGNDCAGASSCLDCTTYAGD